MAEEVTGLEVAVVGMAGRFPGARDVDELWENVQRGRSAFRDFRTDELDAAGVPLDLREEPDYVAAGAVLDDVELFDGPFFGYSPRDAALLDPQHRLFLECAWHALEDAGIAGRGGSVGVYASTSISTYLIRHLLPGPAASAQVSDHELVLGNDKDTLATRVAYHLGLRGPALSVQCACSSSLVAVHLACQALLAGECEAALAGGVSIRLPQHAGYRYQPGGILSRDGRCRPFEAGAAGVVGGNGAAVVVLKRLDAARRDADVIHAVIRGSAVTNDGAAKVSFTAPGVAGQAAAIHAAHVVAGVDPATIGYVEAHGTGTELGDPVEVAALTDAFARATSQRGFCALGSVKGLIGHLDAAAGVTGLIVAALAVRDGVVPPRRYVHRPNPHIDFAASPFTLRGCAEWPVPDVARRAGVNSAGMGGTNAHVVIEQPPEPESAQRPGATPATANRPQLLLVSARTPHALVANGRALADLLDADEAPQLDRVAHALTETRAALPVRWATVAGDAYETAALLRRMGATRAPVDMSPTLAYLFPGQGAQYPGMGVALYRHVARYRSAVDECAEVLRPVLQPDVRDLIASGVPESPMPTRFTQPALFTVEYALAMTLEDVGITASCMLGHSVGEYVAACLGGTFALPDALRLVAARGALMDALPPGAMVSVALPAVELEEYCSETLAVAASNTPTLSVASGSAPEIARLAERLAARGVVCRPLQTSHAFHSPMMEPALEQFEERVAGTPRGAPHRRFVSGLTGEWITDAEAVNPAYWAAHARRTVRFADGMATLLRDGASVFVEVGPGAVLSTFARAAEHGGAACVVPMMRGAKDKDDDVAVLLRGLGRLWVAGSEVHPSRLTTDPHPGRFKLPPYAFERRRYWHDLPGTGPARVARAVPAPHDTGSPAGPGPGARDVPGHAPRPPVVPEPARLLPSDAGGDVVRRLTAIWEDLLGVRPIEPDRDFFEMGGHSLLSVQVLAQVREVFSVRLPADTVVQAPTVAGLAGLVEAARAGTEDPAPWLQAALDEIRGLSPDEVRAQLAREREDAPDLSEEVG